MFHLSAFFQSIDPANAFTNINAVREEMLFTNGVDLRIPQKLTNIVGRGCLINDASLVRAQLSSPSLRTFVNIDVEPIVQAAVFGSYPKLRWHPADPVPLVPDEALNFGVLSDPAAAAVHYGLVWLADGPIQPVDAAVFSVRATSTVQQVAGAWVNGNLTFTQVLPAGTYQVLGFRARSTDGVAARLVFPEQVARPGVAMNNAITDFDHPGFIAGAAGVFGEFPNTIPPTVDVLGGVAAAQVYIIDLLRVR